MTRLRGALLRGATESRLSDCQEPRAQARGSVFMPLNESDNSLLGQLAERLQNSLHGLKNVRGLTQILSLRCRYRLRHREADLV